MYEVVYRWTGPGQETSWHSLMRAYIYHERIASDIAVLMQQDWELGEPKASPRQIQFGYRCYDTVTGDADLGVTVPAKNRK